MMVNLTQGKPYKVLLRYILPLFLSVVFQQIYNIADSVVVGKFLGEWALAAVGNSYEITLVLLAFAFGCNMGASIVTAKNYGAKNYVEMKSAISTSLILTFAVTAVLMAAGFASARPLLVLLNTPAEILPASLSYLRIYLAGLLFLFFYNVSTGIFAALGDSVTPFLFLVISSVANVFMDILFVTAFGMGVEGVAWATFICQGVSAVAALTTLAFRLRKIRADVKPRLFSKGACRDFFLVGIPSTLQQSFISVGNIALQGLINTFGTATIAGYSASVKFNNFAVTSMHQVGSGVSNYTAQNLAAGEERRVKQGFSWGYAIAASIGVLFFVVYFFFNRQIMLLFLNRESTEAIEVGHDFLSIVSPFYVMIAAKLVADGILRGSEKMGLFMVSTFVDLALRVGIAFALAGTYLGARGIWWGWPIGWGVAVVLSVAFFFAGVWKRRDKASRV
ncbi:MAG: MATE family efflux transporter [Clostridia bacterium]|nr:MATE family efflux transporter [Clostridia bacterium]